jgi:hypothetical protein
MRITTYGPMPGPDTAQEESAGGCDATTADTNNATQTIARATRGKVVAFRVAFQLASWLSALLGSLA